MEDGIYFKYENVHKNGQTKKSHVFFDQPDESNLYLSCLNSDQTPV